MKSQMCIFNKLLSVVSVMAVLGLMMPAHAVIDNTGCDDENNLYVNPDLALCSTHVYNIGLTENPDDSAHKQMVKDVVALKTTLITQQMYSQYEILQTTVKRLKTQLKKQVLLDRLKAVSAAANGGSPNDTDSSSGASVSMGQNCTGKSRMDTVYCLRNNYSLMLNQANSRKYTKELKKQMVNDRNAICWLESDAAVCKDENCKSEQSLNKDTIPNCLGQISGGINKLEEGAQRQNNQQRNMGVWGQ